MGEIAWDCLKKHKFYSIHDAAEFIVNRIFEQSMRKVSYDNISIIFLGFENFAKSVKIYKPESSEATIPSVLNDKVQNFTKVEKLAEKRATINMEKPPKSDKILKEQQDPYFFNDKDPKYIQNIKPGTKATKQERELSENLNHSIGYLKGKIFNPKIFKKPPQTFRISSKFNELNQDSDTSLKNNIFS